MLESGTTFGRWVVLHMARARDGFRYWRCRCLCGIEREIPEPNLVRGQSKSCGCLRNEPRLGPGVSAFNRLLRNYRSNARKRKIQFVLTREEFKTLVQSPCHYCGRPPFQVQKAWGNRGQSSYIYTGVDRKNNCAAYMVSNCVPCCKVCNRAKDTMSYVEFMDYLQCIVHEQGV